MGFKLRDSATEWFKNVRKQKPFATDFDVYYFCLMAGLAAGRRSPEDVDKESSRDFVQHFVSPYVTYKKLIQGLLLYAENRRMGIELTEKKDVQVTINELFDPEDVTGLTPKGLEALNSYAAGGFDELVEKMGEKPFKAEDFLIRYCDTLRKVASSSDRWWPNKT